MGGYYHHHVLSKSNLEHFVSKQLEHLMTSENFNLTVNYKENSIKYELERDLLTKEEFRYIIHHQ